MSDKKKKQIDTKPFEELVKILEEHNLTEASYSNNDFSISISR